MRKRGRKRVKSLSPILQNKVAKEEKLMELFGSPSRVRIIDFLGSHSGESYYQQEIMPETGLSL